MRRWELPVNPLRTAIITGFSKLLNYVYDKFCKSHVILEAYVCKKLTFSLIFSPPILISHGKTIQINLIEGVSSIGLF